MNRKFQNYKKSWEWGTKMDQKGPLKITLSRILSWVCGLFFIIIALEMLIEHEYFSAVFMFMVVFVSFPPFSNWLESKLSISVSGSLKFLLVVLLLVGALAVDHKFITHFRVAIFIIGIGNGMINLMKEI